MKNPVSPRAPLHLFFAAFLALAAGGSALTVLESGASRGNGRGADGPPGPRQDSPIRKAELLVLAGAHPHPIRLGLHVRLEPGWHLYWENPGDAGLAPSMRWTLPPDFNTSPLRHPVPEKSVAGGLVSLEHRGDVLFLCDITPVSTGSLGRGWEAAGVFEWMACRESCLTGETPVKVVFPPDSKSLVQGRALLEEFADRFPRPFSESGLTAASGHAGWTGSAWLVEISLAGPRAAEADDFFTFPLDDYVIDNGGVSCRDGKILLSLFPTHGAGAPPPANVGGLVIIRGTGYELSVPIAARHSVQDPGGPGRPANGRHNLGAPGPSQLYLGIPAAPITISEKPHGLEPPHLRLQGLMSFNPRR